MRKFITMVSVGLFLLAGMSVGGCKKQEGAASELANGSSDEAEATAEAIDSNSAVPEVTLPASDEAKPGKGDKETSQRKHSK